MEIRICKQCRMLSTRPRLTFNENGVCSACQWAEEKRNLDWEKRHQELLELCDKYRSKAGEFDVVVPVSGGKDSSMIAHKLKTIYGMHPLCVNINHNPQVTTPINEMNMNNFLDHGFDCIRIYPNPKIVQRLDKIGLVEYGQPYFGWMSAMVVAPIKVALKFGIQLIMYAEEGEVEYGGSEELKYSAVYTMDHVKRLYLSGINVDEMLGGITENTYWWKAPTEEEIERLKPAIAHWSYFENWNSNYNYRYAKENVGLVETNETASGTYNNFAQTDSILYSLHTYFMYLKFGFGRCSQDVCIDIRSGEMDLKRGIELIKQYDEEYPALYEERYLDYYQMNREEFYNNIDRWANKELLEKRDGYWKKKEFLLKLIEE